MMEEIRMRKGYKITGTVFYVLAALLFLYSVWGCIYSTQQISDAMASGGLTFAGNEFSIVNFYMSNSVLYLLYALILFGIGLLLCKPIAVEQLAHESVHASDLSSDRDDHAEKTDANNKSEDNG
jgi:hypothetical protein